VRRRGDGVQATHAFDERHVGAPGIAHGGAVATVFDDLFGFLLYIIGDLAVTRKLEVLYESPVMLGATYDLSARVARIEGRKIFVEARMKQLEGSSIVASASALFLSVDIDHFSQGSRR
jgi:acyl-coenzyme A thioesterase PaaI-like protein